MKKILEQFLRLLVGVISSLAFSTQSNAMPQRVDFQMHTLNSTGEQIEICDPELISCEIVISGSKMYEEYLSTDLPKEPLSYILSLRVVKICKLVIPMAKIIDIPVMSKENRMTTYFLTISRRTYFRECGNNTEKDIIKKKKATEPTDAHMRAKLETKHGQ